MNPYETLPEKSFWKLAVASKNMFDIEDLWDPKFDIKQENKISTYGSCFAQNIGIAMKKRGFCWYSAELSPTGLSEKNQKYYNYNIFSSRTGNIYTTSLLNQWVNMAFNSSKLNDEVWEKNGRFYDPLRPNIEPNGFKSKDELFLSRITTLKAFKKSIKDADFFVFTLGLTESWINIESNFEYPMCPGTIAGEFNSNIHKFKNQSFEEVKSALFNAITLMRSFNKELKILLTVSPVPLTATKSNDHVVLASMYSKSILRAVAGELASNKDYIDYFPSYEIFNSPVFKGSFFEPNQRSVNQYGVNFAMDCFFNSLTKKYNTKMILEKSRLLKDNNDEIVCEEALLEAFGERNE